MAVEAGVVALLLAFRGDAARRVFIADVVVGGRAGGQRGQGDLAALAWSMPDSLGR